MPTPKQTNAQYMALMHAMQTGVAMDHARGSDDGSPKHLRVGVNSAQVGIAALTALLIERGIFTLDEYLESLAREARKEVDRYEALLGPGVKLV